MFWAPPLRTAVSSSPRMRPAIVPVLALLLLGCDRDPPATPAAATTATPTPAATPSDVPDPAATAPTKPAVVPDGHLDAQGLFVNDDAPDPLACTNDAGCRGNTVLDRGGCCRDPRSLRAVSTGYDAWASRHQVAAACRTIKCPPPPLPSAPPACGVSPRCVAQRCVTQCPTDIGHSGASFELRIERTEQERSKDARTTRIVALVIDDELHWEQTAKGAQAEPPIVERRTLTPAERTELRRALERAHMLEQPDVTGSEPAPRVGTVLSLTLGLVMDGHTHRHAVRGTLLDDGLATELSMSDAVTGADAVLEVLRRAVQRPAAAPPK